MRLVWDPVSAADLAGYVVFRADGEGAPVPVSVTEKAILDTFFSDTTIQPRRRYRYTVVAVAAGNASPPSPEAVAETF